MRLIDADRLKEAIRHDYFEHFTAVHSSGEIALVEMILYDIDELAWKSSGEEAHGEWILENVDTAPYCSACYEQAILTSGHFYFMPEYCPHCGTKMKP